MTSKPTLRVLLLGAPVVLIDEQPLQIQRRLLRWLLAYLACQKEMVGRGDLILRFWPDKPEEVARRHLREMLSKLRAQLPDPEMILTEQDRVGLDPSCCSSDVLDFQALFAQTSRAIAQTPASAPLTQAVHQKVVQAVRLWRTAHFMAGATLPESESLYDWLLTTSQQLETQRARLLERLVDHDTTTGDTESATQWLHAALEGDETNESLQYRLLHLLHAQDRYSEALNYCSYLQELFKREGYSELPPSLLSLSRQIREEAAQPVSPSSRPAWLSLEDMQVPFVGRQALLQELQFAVRRGRPVMLFGEAGAGKSRLVRELFFSLKPPPRLLLAPARMMESRLPFQPIIDMLRHDIQAEEWKQMDLAWVTPLSLLLPELTIMRPEIRTPSFAPEQERSLVYEALRQLFITLGKKQRYLLFLDNAQWADEDTLWALAYLAERGISGENGTLILAARPEETTPHLESFLNRPRSAYSVQRLSLPPLDPEEISGLTRYVLGDAFVPAIVSRLEKETGGNPLFLLETLRLVLDYSLSPKQNTPMEEGQWTATELRAAIELRGTIERLPLSSTVHNIIRERLQHLTPYDAQVLNIAAVIGNEFSTEVLESTAMLPPEQVAQSLESLAQDNLIRAVLEDRPSSGYAFVHEKVREVIQLDLSPARKRLFHLRIARALEQIQQGQSAEMEAVLATHYEEAGELNAAFQHWLKTSLYAWRMNQKGEAIRSLENAEQILHRLGSQASDVSIYQLYRQWGRLAYDLSSPEIMEQVFHRLLLAGQHRQNPLLTGSAYNGFAQVAELRIQPEQGLAYLDKGRPFLDQAGRLFERIEANNHRAAFLLQTGKFRDAQSVLQQTLSMGERASDVQGIEARAQTEYWQAVLFTATGWPALALEMAEKSQKDSEEAFYPFGVMRAIGMQAVAKTYMGRYRESLQMAMDSLQRAKDMHFPFLAGDMHGTAGLCCLMMGDLQGCWDHVQAALEITRQYPFSYLKEGMLCLLGDVYAFLEDFDKAAELYQEGAQSGMVNFQSLDSQIHLARVNAIRGETEQAIEAAEACIAYALSNGLMMFHLQAQLAKAGILVHTRQMETALPILDFVSAEARQRCLPEMEARAALLKGQVALITGQPAEAVKTAQLAAEQAQARGNFLIEMRAYRIWLHAARVGHLDSENWAAESLAERMQILVNHTHAPELRPLLTKMQESVDKKP